MRKRIRLDCLAGRVFHAWNCLERGPDGKPPSLASLAAGKLPRAVFTKIIQGKHMGGTWPTTQKVASALRVSAVWLQDREGPDPTLSGPIVAPQSTKMPVELLEDVEDCVSRFIEKHREHDPSSPEVVALSAILDRQGWPQASDASVAEWLSDLRRAIDFVQVEEKVRQVAIASELASAERQRSSGEPATKVIDLGKHRKRSVVEPPDEEPKK